MYDLKSLEFEFYKETIKKNFSSKFAIDELDGLYPYDDLDTILKNQQILKETMRIDDVESIRLFNDSDFYDFLGRLDEPFYFCSPKDFIVFKNFFRDLFLLKKQISKDSKYLKEYLTAINTFEMVIDEIVNKIDDDGCIKDNATKSLLRTRKGIKNIRKEISAKLYKIVYGNNAANFLQERIVTEKNNRFVLLCKPHFKQYLFGIVHGVSNTGQTFHVEPELVVGDNNRYQEYKSLEDNEILDLLKNLNLLLRKNSDSIKTSVNNYKKIRYYIDLSKVYRTLDIVFPLFGDNILFRKIHHPLISFVKKDKSVALDFEMDKNCNLTVISGPNTGGKTAAIKSLGLNHIIAKCGLPLIGSYAEVVNFKKILADIGDNQSLIVDLSTFSAHLKKIQKIVVSADNDTLIIIDEPGTGTDPKEGASFAQSILEYLLGKKSKIIITTHFTEIKAIGISDKNSQTYSVDFDYDNFAPVYQLMKGVIGSSDPILVAKKLGFYNKIVDRAKDLIEENSSLAEKSLDEINKMKIELLRKERELQVRYNEFKVMEEDLQRNKSVFEKQKMMKEVDLLQEAYLFLQKGKDIIKRRGKNTRKETIEKDMEVVAEKIDNLRRKKERVKDVDVNDIIYLDEYNKTGQVVSVNKDSIDLIIDGKKIVIKKDYLFGEKVKQDKKNEVVVNTDHTAVFSNSINVIGETVEEATQLLEDFLDKALLEGMSKAYIVHGRGTGALRKGIHDYLSSNMGVSYRQASQEEGGTAVTIVEL